MAESDATITTETTSTELSFTPLKGGEIRLLCFLDCSALSDIHCHMLNSTDALYESGMKYTALSYCWGQSELRRNITLNGRQTEVTDNLWMALAAIWEHHYRPTYYWVDALCINQQDIQERNAQVAQMWRIFHEAELVFAWLGPSGPKTQLVFTYISDHALAGFWDTSMIFDDPDYETQCAYYDLLYGEGYFERAWIIPENLQASSLRFFYGAFSCDWVELRACGLAPDVLNTRQALQTSRLSRSQATQRDDAMAMTTCLTTFSNSACSDPRDRIFAMLGHPTIKKLDTNGIMRPDYSMSLHEVWLATPAWHDQLYPHCKSRWDPYLRASHLAGCFSGVDYIGTHPLKPGNFRAWLDLHEVWKLSFLPDTIVLGNGFKVDCTGPILSYLLNRDGS